MFHHHFHIEIFTTILMSWWLNDRVVSSRSSAERPSSQEDIALFRKCVLTDVCESSRCVFSSHCSCVQAHTSRQTGAVCTVWCRGLTVTRRAAVPAPTCRRCWRASAEALWSWSGHVWTVTVTWWTPEQTPRFSATTKQKRTVSSSDPLGEATASTRRGQVKPLCLRITAGRQVRFITRIKLNTSAHEDEDYWNGCWGL